MRPTRVVRVTVNGETYERLVEVRKSLADFLRQDLELTGTHLGCEHGVCSACTVLLDGQPVRSCLLFAVQLDGAELQTVEGLAQDAVLHPIQEAFQDNFALQCGYCTPGFLLTAYDLLRRARIRAARRSAELAGNICRCTGYHAIVDAVEDAAAQPRSAPVIESPRAISKAVGQPVKRVEDPRLLAGQGRYVDDLRLPRMVSRRPPAWTCAAPPPCRASSASSRRGGRPALPAVAGHHRLRGHEDSPAVPARGRQGPLRGRARRRHRGGRPLRRRGRLRPGGGGVRAAPRGRRSRGRDAPRRPASTRNRATTSSTVAASTRARSTGRSPRPTASIATSS